MRKVFSIVLCALTLSVIYGCSKPPEVEMQTANSAIEGAKAAEAELYAPNSFAMARDTLSAAMAAKTEQDAKFALFRSYTKSKNLYVSAKAMADKAVADATAEKERVKAAVTQKLAQAQELLTVTEEALNKAPKGKGNKAEIELMKSDLEAAKASFGQANNEFNAGKYLSAKSKVEVVISRTQQVADELAKAKEMKAGKKSGKK